MKTVRFEYSSSFGGYRCSEPGDQDGLYVRAEVAQKMLAACKMILAGPHDAEAIADMLPEIAAAIAAAEPEAGK